MIKGLAKLSSIALPLLVLVGCATCPSQPVSQCDDAELRAALERCEAALAAERAKHNHVGGK